MLEEAYEKHVAVSVWKLHQPHKPIACPYDRDHPTVRSVSVDGETLLYCSECDVVVGPVPEYVMEFYRGYVRLGWIKPLPPPQIREEK